MISKKDLSGYEIQSIEQYFDMIVDSVINGQHSQADNLIQGMSKNQKKDCLDYLGIADYKYNDVDLLKAQTRVLFHL